MPFYLCVLCNIPKVFSPFRYLDSFMPHTCTQSLGRKHFLLVLSYAPSSSFLPSSSSLSPPFPPCLLPLPSLPLPPLSPLPPPPLSPLCPLFLPPLPPLPPLVSSSLVPPPPSFCSLSVVPLYLIKTPVACLHLIPGPILRALNGLSLMEYPSDKKMDSRDLSVLF